MNRNRRNPIFSAIPFILCIILTACSPGLLIPSSGQEPTSVGIISTSPDTSPRQANVPDTGSQGKPKAVTITASGELKEKIDEFTSQLGQDNGGNPGWRTTGWRTINWDTLPENLNDPADYQGDYFNASNAPDARGIVMMGPGQAFRVSANSKNTSGTPALFGKLNLTYQTTFKAFSGESVFSPIGSNFFEVQFYVPGTGTPGLVRGFGAVFSDVDARETLLEFLDEGGKSLGKYYAPEADGELSFIGVLFDEPVVSKVRIKLGNTPIGVNDGDGYDVVVMDDIFYAEPQPTDHGQVNIPQATKPAVAFQPTPTLVEIPVITATGATATPAVKDEFLLNFEDTGDKRLSGVTVDLTGLPPAPEGKTYAVWLVGYTGNHLYIGEAVPGQIFIYTDPNGYNLIGRFRGGMISLEKSEDVQSNSVHTPGEMIYSGEIPAQVIPLLQRLVVSAPDTPGQMPYGYGLKEQAAIAVHHAEVQANALKSGDLPGAKMHLEHLWNTMVGLHSADYGDLNEDGRAENYGDGFGLLLYASRMINILDQILKIDNLNDHYRQQTEKTAQCTRSIANKLGPEIKEKVKAILAAQDAVSVVPIGEVVDSTVLTLANGFDTDGNGKIDNTEGECGAAQVYTLSRGLYHIHMKMQSSKEHEH